MPRETGRQPPRGDYSKSAKNLRRFAEGRQILRQGQITSETQSARNVQQIIKYLQGPQFESRVKELAGEKADGS